MNESSRSFRLRVAIGTWLLVLSCIATEDASEPSWLHTRDPCDEHMAPDLGWLQWYIEVGFFSDYRRQAWIFYNQNETSYAFLWLNSIAYANLDFVREACPAAALLALLLRAEERLPMREGEPPLIEYAALAGDVPIGVRERWPLRQGLDRVRLLAERLATPGEYTVDVVMPYCDEPLHELLSTSTGYDEPWLATRVPLRHARLILYRLEMCGAAGEEDGQLPPHVATVAPHFASVKVFSVRARPEAWEVARYFMHVAHRYDDLADFTIFLHPDVFEHVNPRTFRNVMQSLRVGTFCRSGLGVGDELDGEVDGLGWCGFLSLSHQYLARPSRVLTPSADCTDLSLASFDELRRDLLGHVETQEEARDDFGSYCCSQFLVHRSRILQWSHAWYQRAVAGIEWEHCATSYMELLWHAIFNRGRLHDAKRQMRLELPLFLRVDNFLEETADGLV